MLNINPPKNLELFLWAVMPAVITLLLFLLYTIPKHIWGIGSVMPILPLIPIFYWGRIKTPEIPTWFAFFMGILMDIVSGLPLGLSALLYMLFLVALHSRNKHHQNGGFIFTWWFFTLSLAIFCSLQFIIMSLYGNQISALPPALLQWLLTVGFYPLFHKLFDKLAEQCQHRRWILSIIH